MPSRDGLAAVPAEPCASLCPETVGIRTWQTGDFRVESDTSSLGAGGGMGQESLISGATF